MNDLIEIVEDLKDIDTFGSDTTAFEDILVKWNARLIDAQDESEIKTRAVIIIFMFCIT